MPRGKKHHGVFNSSRLLMWLYNDCGLIPKLSAKSVDNNRYRWDMNFLPNETQTVICKIDGKKNKAEVTIEDEDESPHHTYVFSLDYSHIGNNAKNAYQSHVQHKLLLMEALEILNNKS